VEMREVYRSFRDRMLDVMMAEEHSSEAIEGTIADFQRMRPQEAQAVLDQVEAQKSDVDYATAASYLCSGATVTFGIIFHLVNERSYQLRQAMNSENRQKALDILENGCGSLQERWDQSYELLQKTHDKFNHVPKCMKKSGVVSEEALAKQAKWIKKGHLDSKSTREEHLKGNTRADAGAMVGAACSLGFAIWSLLQAREMREEMLNQIGEANNSAEDRAALDENSQRWRDVLNRAKRDLLALKSEYKIFMKNDLKNLAGEDSAAYMQVDVIQPIYMQIQGFKIRCQDIVIALQGLTLQVSQKLTGVRAQLTAAKTAALANATQATMNILRVATTKENWMAFIGAGLTCRHRNFSLHHRHSLGDGKQSGSI